MSLAVKYIAQVYDKTSGRIIEENRVYEKDIIFPDEMEKFGLRQKEQLKLVEESQNIFLKYQVEKFAEYDTCPKCGKKLAHQGRYKSNFHDVFTDHEVSIYRLSCTCGWDNQYTVKGIYGSASHPELVKLQAITGSQTSFVNASKVLNQQSSKERKINNHATIRNYVNKVGTILGELKENDPWTHGSKASKELVVVTDGGHVQNKELGKHSFEEFVTTIYKPEDVITVSKNRKEISEKICVGSARSDELKTIKKLTINACKKMGMNNNTDITALTDGANNCWPVIKALKDKCSSITMILDWFHIGKYFQSRRHKIPKEFEERYDKIKWHLWHGNPKTAILRLEQLTLEVVEIDALEILDEIKGYINGSSPESVDKFNPKLATNI